MSAEDVRQTLQCINPHKAAGPDNIMGRVLKDCAHELTEVWVDIITSHSPSLWCQCVSRHPPSSQCSKVQQCPHQYAFRKNHSISDAVSSVIHSALTHLESRDSYIRLLFLDFSSAFNAIIPQTPANKLLLLLTHRPQSKSMALRPPPSSSALAPLKDASLAPCCTRCSHTTAQPNTPVPHCEICRGHCSGGANISQQ